MKRMQATPAFAGKKLAWVVLAVFVLVLAGSVCHLGLCRFHDTADEACPVCVMIFWYHRLLQAARLYILSFIPLVILKKAGVGSLLFRKGAPFRLTPVTLCVKLLN